jgi:hypothetical protein
MPYSKSRRICLVALSVDVLFDLAALVILILTFFLKWDMVLSVTIALALNCAEILTLVVGLILVRVLAVNWASISLLAVFLLLTLVLDFLPIFALSSFLHAPWDFGLSLHLDYSSDSLFAISLLLSLAETFALVITLVTIIIAVRGEVREDSISRPEGESGPPAEGSDGTPSADQSEAANGAGERTPLLPSSSPPPLPSSPPPPPSSPPPSSPPPPSSSSRPSPSPSSSSRGEVSEAFRKELEAAMVRERTKSVGTGAEAGIPTANSDQQAPPQTEEILEQTAE